ncbi:MAG: dTDP-4-dehydrorhamnose 3,5-epimerase [Gammaproteobacteria bacterium RIFCSPLOWO2_02_FULL_42_9]|nr:MAG: dTDP-4-dehydrorhamnose 3,5-epimerase [Gammaproteobacteria bacterium RIFCSPLOWO2_02_FULL_42_9]
MKFTKLDIPDVFVIEPEVYKDHRGSFYEFYNKELFSRYGITAAFVQDNCSISSKGILRGLHFQVAPKAQAKLVYVVKGKVFDVAVDLRKDSRTFGQHVAVTLSAENKKVLYIPVGFAHGFCVLEEGTEFCYKVSQVYSPQHERGIVWNDPALHIQWPGLGEDYILSDRDRALPTLNSLKDLSF